MILCFFLLILLVIGLIMAGKIISKKIDKSHKKGKQSKQKLKNSKKYRKTRKMQRLLEHFNLTDKLLTDREIEKCNKILIDNEDKCNCFRDNIPKSNITDCLKRNNNNACIDYNQCKRKFSKLLSGNEPKYNPNRWNDPIIEGSHNCYAYFLDDHIPKIKEKCFKMCNKKGKCDKKFKKCEDLKPQPGDYAGVFNDIYQCKDMVEKIMLDNLDKKSNKRNISKVKFNQRCPKHYYKGAVVVDPNHTYHFYRQDDNVRFSHKQGTLEIENKDANRDPIYVPHLADRNYNKKKEKDGINYTDFCNYLCIPSNKYKDTHAI